MTDNKPKPHVKCWKLVIIDILLLGVSLNVFALFHHVLPKKAKTGMVVADPSVVVKPVSPTPPDDADYAWSVSVAANAPVRLFVSEKNLVVRSEPEIKGIKGLSVDEAVEKIYPYLDNKGAIGGSISIEAVDLPESYADIAKMLDKTKDRLAKKYGGSEDGGYDINLSIPALNLGAKFYDKFNFDGEVINEPDRYVSDKVAIYLSDYRYEGSDCHVADIYLCDIRDFRTVLAQDTFGSNIREQVLSMSERSGAILASNGDFYSVHDITFIIRNGILYSDDEPDRDVCVLYLDGRMESFFKDEFDGDSVIRDQAWQTWCFGPKLLDKGEMPEEFDTEVAKRHPRTAIGYYEPGHYCIVTVDGRSDTSDGLEMEQLSAFFRDVLKCTDAYNVDGGDTSAMYLNNVPVNIRSGDGSRPCADAIIIVDGEGYDDEIVSDGTEDTDVTESDTDISDEKNEGEEESLPDPGKTEKGSDKNGKAG